jgi:hypothetical protein
MTHAKKLKKRIRARARKTGESYTAARRHVMAARPVKTAGPGALAGKDARLVERTGHGRAHWFATLDAFDARAKGHTAAARHLAEAHGVAGWYAQMITVEYERAHGLRAQNQRCTGDYEVSVSKTLPASVPEVARALADRRRRTAWLADAPVDLEAALDAALAGAKSVRVRERGDAVFRYRTDAVLVAIRIDARSDGRSAFVAQTMGLASPADVDRHRAAWKTALAGLAQHLARA